MENYEIVMEELRTLRNLDEKIYTDKGVWNKGQPQIRVEGKEFNIANGTLPFLVHTIRAMKSANLEGSIENIEKGARVFSMLQSIYAYHDLNAEEMASEKVFSEKMYDFPKEVVTVMAQYLLDHVASKDVDVHTDEEGCIYNSISLTQV